MHSFQLPDTILNMVSFFWIITVLKYGKIFGEDTEDEDNDDDYYNMQELGSFEFD